MILLHKVAGYAAIFWTMIHVILYSIDGAQKGIFYIEARETKIVVGWVAGLAMLIILGTALTLRWLPYEAFYTSHAVLSVLTLITMAFHPNTWGAIWVCMITAAFWSADVMIRLTQLLWHSIGNSATLYPLPNGGVRVVMYKSPKTTPGAHCSLWIPSIRLIETHPVAVLSTDPLEFVFASYNGFTGDLYRTSLKKKTVWVSVHGSYGSSIDFANLDKVVFIAGGSGASFTFALAMKLLRSGGNATKPAIEFVWVVRHQGNILIQLSYLCASKIEHASSGSLSWFANELEQLASSARVNLIIHISSPPNSQKDDVEKNSWSGENTTGYTMNDIRRGRPDITKTIENIVAGADPSDRLMVVACGPEGLMKSTRRAVVKNAKSEGPSIDFQSEEYSW